MPCKKIILIVEDNAINRQILVKILQDEYAILEAENGQTALAVLRDKGETISAVLLDLIMPVMDGFEVLRHMHADEDMCKIPVLVASGQTGDEAEIKALALGANDYVMKPYKPAIIRHRIANTIYLRETAAFVNSVRHDSLTGVYSKEYFFLSAQKLLQNHPETNYDVICCDIEHFKLVKDLYGISTGDELLKHVAGMFLKSIGSEGLCGRIGADIFAMVVEHRDTYSNEAFAQSVAYVNQFNVALNIMLRYGIYVVDDRSLSINVMCDRAFLAMESVKGRYETYFAYYDEKIRQKLLQEQFIVSSMKKALTNGEFHVYFQPKYDLKTETISGAEALVRWIHPEKGMMMPGEFIPLFEKNGFITEMDIYVWEQCCKKIRQWIDEGKKPLPISVNVSRADIYNPHIDQILVSLIKKYKISPKYLYLEITESAYTENPEQIIEVVHKLKKRGFFIEMDDFGSGYSSLNMLSRLPIHVLKLDMKFMENEDTKKNSRSILSFIISLAKWMNLRVVAEGVETEDQIKLLRSLNCEYAQGYYYAKPMNAGNFEELLSGENHETNMLENIRIQDIVNEETTKSNLKKMLVLDVASTDYDKIERSFHDQFTVVHMRQTDETIGVIHEWKSQIAMVIFALGEKETSEQIAQLNRACGQYDLPLVTIHTSTEMVKPAIEAGVSDYMMRPYVKEALVNRIGNVICRAQVTQFQRENEVNAAIVEMKKRAEEDSLTGLLNHAEFEMRIHDFFNYNSDPDGVFLILDIDNFKKINDSFGHLMGDKILCAVASTLSDMFHETNIISRMGGDEFGLFIPYRLDLEDLEIKLKKLRSAMTFDMADVTVSCSIGISISPNHGKDYEEIYHHADVALLLAKRSGKNQYKIFEKDMKAPPVTQLEEKATVLLDDVSDAMFVSDAVTSQILYINDTACQLIHKPKRECYGKRCYELFWDRCQHCDRCLSVGEHIDRYYEEDTLLKDGKTPVHIKAKLGNWDGKNVKIHYLQHVGEKHTPSA